MLHQFLSVTKSLKITQQIKFQKRLPHKHFFYIWLEEYNKLLKCLKTNLILLLQINLFIFWYNGSFHLEFSFMLNFSSCFRKFCTYCFLKPLKIIFYFNFHWIFLNISYISLKDYFFIKFNFSKKWRTKFFSNYFSSK